MVLRVIKSPSFNHTVCFNITDIIIYPMFDGQDISDGSILDCLLSMTQAYLSPHSCLYLFNVHASVQENPHRANSHEAAVALGCFRGGSSHPIGVRFCRVAFEKGIPDGCPDIKWLRLNPKPVLGNDVSQIELSLALYQPVQQTQSQLPIISDLPGSDPMWPSPRQPHGLSD
jgi:hypothetical protein